MLLPRHMVAIAMAVLCHNRLHPTTVLTSLAFAFPLAFLLRSIAFPLPLPFCPPSSPSSKIDTSESESPAKFSIRRGGIINK